MTTNWVPVGMRQKIDAAPGSMIINTCSGNDTAERGDYSRWTWANPTNTRFPFEYEGLVFASTECAWQATKMRPGQTEPDEETRKGAWRKGKGRRPAGAWAGHGKPLLTVVGQARRAIYIPAYVAQITQWTKDPTVRDFIDTARDHHTVYLRDHDTGQGIDRNGPMSHAWLLAQWLSGQKLEEM